MKYRRDLQVKLQQKYRVLYKTDAKLYSRQVGYVVAFIRETPALAAIAEHIERSCPKIDAQAWAADNFGWHKADWPDSELGRAKVAWHLLQQWATDPNAAWNFGHNLDPSSSKIDAGVRTATETVVEPLIEYFQEQIGDSSDVLYLLEKYARRVEWFAQDSLFSTYQADTGRGEAVYDRDLRQFLFEQGIDYPFSHPVGLRAGRRGGRTGQRRPTRVRDQALRRRSLRQGIPRQRSPAVARLRSRLRQDRGLPGHHQPFRPAP